MNAQDINQLFRDAGRTLGSVESFTGGSFASEITKVPGASHFYKGGLVTYMTEEKVRLLGISYDDVDKYGVVSQEIAGQMAYRGAAILKVNYCISFTGNAGPEAMEGKPVGEVYIAVTAYGNTEVYKLNLSGSREEIQAQAINEAYEILSSMLNKYN